MHWIAPSEKDTLTETLEKRLYDSADQFRANSGLKAQEFSGPTHDAIHQIEAGEAIIVTRAESVRHRTPRPGGADYIAVCLPAFSP